jgi:hypothetical protein
MLRTATSLRAQLAAVMNQNASLTERAIAVWCASGIGWVAEKREKADLPALLDRFRSLGVSVELVTATGIAAQKTREPIKPSSPSRTRACLTSCASALTISQSRWSSRRQPQKY